MIICGMGWTEIRMSYDEDPDGRVISGERFSPFEAYWDTLASKRNLGDARWVCRGRWWPRKLAEETFPRMSKADLTTSGFVIDETEADHPIDVARAVFYKDNVGEWYNQHKDEVMIYYYQWWEHETIFRIGDPQSGRLVELSSAKFGKIMTDMGNGQAAFPGGQVVKYVKQQKRKYYYAFIAGEFPLEDGEIPCNHFTLLPMCAKHDETKNHWYGVVRSLLDPQRWANKFFSTIQDVLMSNRQGGAFVEEDALVDPEQALEDWAGANPLIQVKSGALSQGKIQERNPIAYPEGVDRLLNYAIGAITDTSGINMELMGLVDRNQPGVLEAQRKQAGMTILARMFDSLRRYQKIRGKVVMYFIQEYISDGRLIRVLGQDGQAQYTPLVKDPSIATYDIIVDEAPTSTNQKEQVWAILSQLLPFTKSIGLPVPSEVIKYLPLPQSLSQAWLQMITQPNPAAQQQQQLQMQGMQAQVEKTQAEANEANARAGLTAAKVEGAQIDNRTNVVNLAMGTT